MLQTVTAKSFCVYFEFYSNWNIVSILYSCAFQKSRDKKQSIACNNNCFLRVYKFNKFLNRSELLSAV